jgi:hypothetical protein
MTKSFTEEDRLPCLLVDPYRSHQYLVWICNIWFGKFWQTGSWPVRSLEKRERIFSLVNFL